MRRRATPYSRIEESRRSRGEVGNLVLLTVALGFLLGLLTNGVSDWLRSALPEAAWVAALAVLGALSLLLTTAAAWLFYGRTESQRAHIDLWLPYHFPERDAVTILGREATSYQPPRHAQRAFKHHYRRGSPALKAFLERRAQAQQDGLSFEHVVAADHLALSQCLALYVLHRYGEESLGDEAPFGWYQVDMPSRRLSMDDLPPPLRDNPFLRADQHADEWRLLLPRDVTFTADETWTLSHRRYGWVTLRWFSPLAVAGRSSQPYRALTTRLRLGQDAQLYVVGGRMEVTAEMRCILLPASEPFQEWAAGLLARLEEALDFQYYIATRPARIALMMEEHVGWVPAGTSIVEMLQAIEGRIEDLEMGVAVAALKGAGADADEEEPRESFVV